LTANRSQTLELTLIVNRRARTPRIFAQGPIDSCRADVFHSLFTFTALSNSNASRVCRNRTSLPLNERRGRVQTKGIHNSNNRIGRQVIHIQSGRDSSYSESKYSDGSNAQSEWDSRRSTIQCQFNALKKWPYRRNDSDCVVAA
jgi:hypothetical protein